MPPVLPDNPTRILIIRPSALGDVCRSVPILVSLRRRWPNARIDWLVQDGYAAAVNQHPDLRLHGGGVVEFPRHRFAKWWKPKVAAELFDWLLALKKSEYGLVIDAQGLARSGLFSWATRARHRYGYADAPEWAWLGLTSKVEAPASLHTVDRMLKLVEAVGAPATVDLRLYTSAAAKAFAKERVLRLCSRYVVLAPTSRWPGKLWPPERYRAVAERLLGDPRCGVDGIVVVGAAPERGQVVPLIEMATERKGIISLVGLTSVETLMGVIERSALVIASDSAALHMAVGFSRPIVGLYGPTSKDLVGPYRRPADVLQHIHAGESLDHKDEPSGRGMMARITVDEVVHAARSRLVQ